MLGFDQARLSRARFLFSRAFSNSLSRRFGVSEALIVSLQVPGPANAFGVHSPNGTLSVSFSNPNLAIFSDPDRLHSMTGSDLEQEETNRIVEA